MNSFTMRYFRQINELLVIIIFSVFKPYTYTNNQVEKSVKQWAVQFISTFAFKFCSISFLSYLKSGGKFIVINQIIYKLIIYTLPRIKDCLFLHMTYRSLTKWTPTRNSCPAYFSSGLPVILINRVKRGLWFDMNVRYYVFVYVSLFRNLELPLSVQKRSDA